MRKRRKNARARPHNGQRLYSLTLNLLGRSAFIRKHFLANGVLPYRSQLFANGIPIRRNKARPSSSLSAVVVTVTVIPRVLSTLSA